VLLVIFIFGALIFFNTDESSRPGLREKYLDDLTNWYIRRSRRRFWKSENDSDKKQAYTTLYQALLKFCILACPVVPFLTEEIYQNLKVKNMPETIHLCDYPVENKKLRDLNSEREMELIQKTTEMGRSIRAKVKINLRRPLNSVVLVTKDKDEKKLLLKMEEIIKEEINVKSVTYEEDEQKLVNLSCKANFKVLGKRIGKYMKQAADIINNFTIKDFNRLENNETIKIEIENQKIELTKEDIIINREEKEGLTVMNEGTLTVALDTHLTQDLIDEGIARQFIRHVQNLRKDKDLNVIDKITIYYSDSSTDIENALKKWNDLIKQETLALDITKNNKADLNVNIEDVEIKIGIEKK